MDSSIPTQSAYSKHAAEHTLALVALGNPLRGDDGVAAAVLSMLPEELRQRWCILNAGSYTRDIPEFLSGHRAGIIIDATELASAQPLVIDLSDPSTRRRAQVEVDCCHALSWMDELALYNGDAGLPERLIFVGMPAYDTSWQQQLSPRMLDGLPSLSAAVQKLVLQESAFALSMEMEKEQAHA